MAQRHILWPPSRRYHIQLWPTRLVEMTLMRSLPLIPRLVEWRLHHPRAHRLIADDHVELAALGRQRRRHIPQAQVLAERWRGHASGHSADTLSRDIANLIAAARNASPYH